MSQFFEIHPENPQPRLIHQAVKIVREGGIIVYPTDSSYALGCHIGDKAAMERICRIRQVSKNHNFTLVCSDLSEITTYAKVDNQDYRLMKGLTPGPYTFILKATREVPKRLQNAKRKTIGIRVPDTPIVRDLLRELNEPMMSSTLILPGDDLPIDEPWEIRERLEHEVDLVIDGGHCPVEPTSVVVLTDNPPTVYRHGRGDVSMLV
jgi:tRNA threonylcarbamoyl adenosine modification protein (Sua5/YciO/YrdC/YwlC family)